MGDGFLDKKLVNVISLCLNAFLSTVALLLVLSWIFGNQTGLTNCSGILIWLTDYYVLFGVSDPLSEQTRFHFSELASTLFTWVALFIYPFRDISLNPQLKFILFSVIFHLIFNRFSFNYFIILDQSSLNYMLLSFLFTVTKPFFFF